jgi:hypothetical protein
MCYLKAKQRLERHQEGLVTLMTQSFTLWETIPHTQWIRGYVGPTLSLDVVVKKKIPAGELNPGHPTSSLITT